MLTLVSFLFLGSLVYDGTMNTIPFQAVCDEALISAPFGGVRIAIQNNQLLIELKALPVGVQVLPSHHDVALEVESLHPLVSLATKQVIQYLQQANTVFSLPVQQVGTAFQQQVWQAIVAIPRGQTRTYSDLANQIGSGPRAVANACGANRLPLVIPCHRVVAKNGLGGFMQGTHNGWLIKQWLLQHELNDTKGYLHE